MIPAPIQRRLAALEEKHRAARVLRRSTSETHAQVREILSCPAQVREIKAGLRGCKPDDISDEYHARHMAALAAALRTDR
jgi:hypothetical protein